MSRDGVTRKGSRDSTYCEVVLAEDDVINRVQGGQEVQWKRSAEAEAIMQLLAAEAKKAPVTRNTVAVQPSPSVGRRPAPSRSEPERPRRRSLLSGKLASTGKLARSPKSAKREARASGLSRSHLSSDTLSESQEPIRGRSATIGMRPTGLDDLVADAACSAPATAGITGIPGMTCPSPNSVIIDAPLALPTPLSLDEPQAKPSAAPLTAGIMGLPGMRCPSPDSLIMDDDPVISGTGFSSKAQVPSIDASSVPRKAESNVTPGRRPSVSDDILDDSSASSVELAMDLMGDDASGSSVDDTLREAKRLQGEIKLRAKGKGMKRRGLLRNASVDVHAQADEDVKDLAKAQPLLAGATVMLARLQQAEANLKKRIQALEEKEKDLVESCSVLSNESPGAVRKKKKRHLAVDVSDVVIGTRLGAGASGAVVYSCIVDGWVCAMKQLNTSSKVDEEAFEREMSLLYQLPPHPNIVKYLFHKTIKGKLCLFMTRHETTLEGIIDKMKKTSATFSRSELLFIAGQVANGISFLHKNRILHRDIKCDNIYCSYGPTGNIKQVVVADFDTAKKTGVTNVPQSTIGTVGFMAPEVFSMDNEDGYSFGADVFSFGMVLYNMMTLKEPYYDYTNRFNVYKAILANEPPLLGANEVERYGTTLVQLHRRCVQLDPKHRPTIQQAIDTVANVLETG